MLNNCIQLKPKFTVLGKKKIRDLFRCSLLFSLAVIGSIWTDQQMEGVKKSCVFTLRFLFCNL